MDRQKSSSMREKEDTRSSSSLLDDIVSEWIRVREMFEDASRTRCHTRGNGRTMDNGGQWCAQIDVNKPQFS